MEEKITKQDVIIAEFMGYEIQKDPTERFFGRYKSPIGAWHKEIDLSFHHDWNWLMEVIKEIGNKTDFELVMGYDYCYWNNEGEQPLEGFEGGYGDIIYIYSAIISFIKWYNENK